MINSFIVLRLGHFYILKKHTGLMEVPCDYMFIVLQFEFKKSKICKKCPECVWKMQISNGWGF